MSKDEHIELLQIKDQELDGMKNEILKEQQCLVGNDKPLHKHVRKLF